jgi:hypothetical protein
MFNDFETAEIQTGETSIFVRRSGSGSPILLLHGFPQTHLMCGTWRPYCLVTSVSSAQTFAAMAKAAAPPPRPIMRLMRNERWRETWSPSWSGSVFPAFRLLDMIVVVASPTVWLSIIRSGSSGLLCSISFRLRPFENEPTCDSRSPTGPGRCWPSLNRCRNAS